MCKARKLMYLPKIGTRAYCFDGLPAHFWV